MRAEVFAPHELNRVRRHDWQPKPGRQAHGPLHMRLDHPPGSAQHSGTSAKALNFDVEAVTKQRTPIACQAFRQRPVVHHERLAEIPVVRARERDQTIATNLVEPALPELGPPTILVGAISPGKKLGQPQVSAMRLAQQKETVRLVAVCLVLEPDVASDDGFHPAGARLLIELDHAEDIGKVGDRERRHRVLRRRLHGLVEANNAIHDRVFAVQSQMDERRRHAGYFKARRGQV